MLLWINGPFGGGKTQTAHEIRRRLPGSVVCDPEEPGFGLQRMLPRELRGDFQDLKAWRQGVVEVLDLTLTRREGVVIAPMTVTDPGHFAETVGRLRELGHDVRHFTLLAEHLWTDHSTVPKTADRIAVLAGLTLRPNHEGRLRTRLRQAAVGVRHIRRG
ncbi:ATP-binding protein [Streptomyces pseudogriseolus]|uniref:ATP-binding protein n=1 Tax=Streptomyces pseudogriseolus TaxID=36817 RepID=UPI003FA207DB